MGLALVILLGLTLVVVALAVVSARLNLPFSSDRLPAADREPVDEDTPGDREREVREHVRSRNEWRAWRGQPQLAEDAEFRRLLALAAPQDEDSDLRAEARVLVERANARRIARGEEPLDEETEIDRRLREFGA